MTTMQQVKVAEIQFHPWDRSYFFDPEKLDVKLGDRVLVETKIGQEIGKIIGFGNVATHELEVPLQPIQAIPTEEDFKKLEALAEQKPEDMKKAREIVHEHNLSMKLIDIVYSYDNRRITIAFTANQRIDFRNAVKDLNLALGKTVRLQQIRSRDIAAEMGGIGPCGRETCCSTWKNDIEGISSELVAVQGMEHRGADRLSGLCGRLKCCLAYESEGYRMCGAKMPEVGTYVHTKTYGEGEVITRNILTHTITLKDKKGQRTDVPMGCDRVGCNGCSAGGGCCSDE